MRSRRDRCIEDLSRWFAEHRRRMTHRAMRPIVQGHFPEEADQVAFFEYLSSPEGAADFRTALRKQLHTESAGG